MPQQDQQCLKKGQKISKIQQMNLVHATDSNLPLVDSRLGKPNKLNVSGSRGKMIISM